MKRHWVASRQAYMPRLWITFLITLTAATSLSALLQPSMLGAFALGVFTGIVPIRVQWWLWRRRHPLLSMDEYFEIKREHAHLN